jgi:hypothetical protein
LRVVVYDEDVTYSVAIPCQQVQQSLTHDRFDQIVIHPEYAIDVLWIRQWARDNRHVGNAVHILEPLDTFVRNDGVRKVCLCRFC